MTKTYIAPEVEIKRFNVEDIMTASGVGEEVTMGNKTYADDYGTAVGSVTYSELFNL